MFNDRKAKAYDLGKCNPLIVGSIVFIVCLFGSLNTYYDQFLRVSQLPVDRNELTPFKNFSVNLTGNRFEFKVQMQYIFSITRDYWLDQLVIKYNVGIFTVVVNRSRFLDLQWDRDGNCNFRFLSPVYGIGKLTVWSLGSEIVSEEYNITGISWLYPDHTLVEDNNLEYKVDHILLTNRKIKTFFHCEVELANNRLAFENGRAFEHDPKRQNSKDYLDKTKCERHEGDVYIFAEPPEGKHPFDWMISVLNPIANHRGDNDQTFVVLRNEEPNVLRHLLKVFPNILQVDLNSCHYFENARILSRTSHWFENSRKQFHLNIERRNKVVFLVNESSVLDDIAKIAAQICERCEPEISSASEESVIEKVSNARSIVTQDDEDLAFGFLLGEGTTVYTLDEPTRRGQEIARYLHLNVSQLLV